MRRFVLDTNLYIQATRSDAGASALQNFFIAQTPWLYLHSAVALELLAGATSAEKRRSVTAAFIRPLERRGRVLTPSHASWKRAGQALAELLRDRRISPNGISRLLLNDCLIAASAAEYGFTLVTANTRDFELLAEYVPLHFVAPWPR